MYKRNNLFRNLIKIRDETLPSNELMEHIITCFTLLIDDTSTATNVLRDQYNDTYVALTNSQDGKQVSAVDPEGQFSITVSLTDNDNNDDLYKIRLIELNNGDEFYHEYQAATYGGDDNSAIDYILATLSTGEIITMGTVLQRINDAYGLNQLILTINDAILQNGKIDTASISQITDSMSIQKSDSVNALLINLASAGVITGWQWTTILYEMFKGSKDALDQNSFVLDATRPNVVQGFIGFGLDTVISIVADIVSIALAKVTMGLSILVNFAVKGIIEASQQIEESTEYTVKTDSITNYLGVPVVCYKRSVASMDPQCSLSALLGNNYAKYVDTPMVDYFLWSDDTYIYVNGFLKLRVDPICLGWEYTDGTDKLYTRGLANYLDPDSQRVAEIFSDNDEIGRAISAAILAYIEQSLEFTSGILSPEMGSWNDYWTSRRMDGLYFAFSHGLPDAGMSYDGDFYISHPDEFFTSYKPANAIAGIAALISLDKGSLQGARVGDAIKLLQLASRYCDNPDYWNGEGDGWDINSQVRVPLAGAAINLTCRIWPFNASLNLGGSSSGTGNIYTHLANFMNWYGVMESLGDDSYMDIPWVLISQLWCSDNNWNSVNNYSYTIVDSIPTDRLVMLPKYDRRSLIISLAVIGAISSAVAVLGAIISRSIKIRRNRSAIVRKEKLDTLRRQYLTDKTPESLNNYEKQIRRYNLFANLFNWRLYDGSTGMYVSNGVAGNTNSIFPILLNKLDNADSDDLNTVLESIASDIADIKNLIKS